MKIGLYGAMDNGDVIDRSIPYIAVDKGLSHLYKQGITPLMAIGDFDSLDDLQLLEDLQIEKFPVRKDDTDTALALQYAIAHGYDEIDIYGVIGGRIDHFMAALILLKRYAQVAITLYDRQNKIQLLKAGTHHLPITYDYFSIFALKDTHLTLHNCTYPLDDYLLRSDDPLCVSNSCDGILEICNSEDVIFIQANNKEDRHE